MRDGLHISPAHRGVLECLLREHLPDVEAWAYGSRVNGRSDEGSDLNLALRGPGLDEIATEQVVDFLDAVGESAIPFLVKARDWARLSERSKRKVERDHVCIADGWTEAPFEEIVDFREGPGILAKDFRESGVPLVRLSGLSHSASILTGCNYLDPDMVAGKWSHFALAEGDTLLSTSASLGRISVVQRDGVGAIPYTGIIRMRPRDGRLLRPFIRYLLESPAFQRQVEMAGVGSVIRHFGPMHLRQMHIRIPPVQQQGEIVRVLAAIDGKIELNRRMNETLETMAHALFKSWFVDFEPVQPDWVARNPAIPAWDLSRFRLVDSNIGPVPEGWNVSEIGKEVTAVGGGTPSTKVDTYWRGGRHAWATPKDLSGLTAPVLLDTEKKVTDAGLAKISSGLLPAGTVLMSSRAPIGYLAITERPVAVNQGFVAMVCAKGLPNLYVLCWCRQNLRHIRNIAGGSTFAEISKKVFKAIPVLVPPPPVLQSFVHVVGPLYARIVTNVKQAEYLADLRDALLPKLLSGQLRVPDAERIAAAVK